MDEERKSPRVAFWAAVLPASAFAVYLLAYGPVLYLYAGRKLPPSAERAADAVYSPLHSIASVCPQPVPATVKAYTQFWKRLGTPTPQPPRRMPRITPPAPNPHGPAESN